MLKQKALTDVLGQVNTGGVEYALLFNKEGLVLAYSGLKGVELNPNIYSALVASLVDSFGKKGGRDDLKEAIVECENGIVGCTRVANMLVAVKAKTTVPVGLLRAKLHALVRYLDAPLTAVSLNS